MKKFLPGIHIYYTHGSRETFVNKIPCLGANATSGIRTHDPLITSREHEPLHQCSHVKVGMLIIRHWEWRIIDKRCCGGKNSGWVRELKQEDNERERERRRERWNVSTIYLNIPQFCWLNITMATSAEIAWTDNNGIQWYWPRMKAFRMCASFTQEGARIYITRIL